MKSNRKVQNRYQSSNQMRYGGYEELVEFDSALIKYNSHLVNLFIERSKFSSDHEAVDFGAGIGTLTELWYGRTGKKPSCVEIDPECKQYLINKGFEVYPTLKSMQKKYDCIYSSNVLEHIEDDLNVLSELRDALKNSGTLILYVPALQFLFSDLDIKVGHFRRYGRRELIKKVESQGFEVNTCEFVDSIGVIASLIIKILGWRKGFKIGSRNSVIFYDRFVFPVSAILDRMFFKKILGKNLMLIASRLPL